MTKYAKKLRRGNLRIAVDFGRRRAFALHWLCPWGDGEDFGRVVGVHHPQHVLAGRILVGGPLVDGGVGRQIGLGLDLFDGNLLSDQVAGAVVRE